MLKHAIKMGHKGIFLHGAKTAVVVPNFYVFSTFLPLDALQADGRVKRSKCIIVGGECAGVDLWQEAADP